MQSKAPTVAAYLEELPAERRTLLDAVRKVIRANLDKGIQEVMNYGMIGYVIPHSIYPDGYHCDPSKPFPYGGLASQKNYCSLYLFPVYAEAEDWFREEWKKGGKKLEDLDLEVLARALRRFTVAQTLQCYQQLLGNRAKPGKRRGASQPTSKPTSKPASKPASKRKLESKLDAGDEPGVKSGRGKPVGTAAKRAGKTTTSVAKVKAKAQPSKKQSRRG